MKKVMLNLTNINSKQELHEYLEKELGFPYYYGKNLDALYDCLTDIYEPTAIGLSLPKCLEPDMDKDEAKNTAGNKKKEPEIQAGKAARPADLEMRKNNFSSMEDQERMKIYLKKTCRTFAEAEEDNHHLAVFFCVNGILF